jgi:translation initiation factor 4G
LIVLQEARKKELERQLKDLVDFNKKKSLANMRLNIFRTLFSSSLKLTIISLNFRFIGELFKLEILSLDSMHYSILRLLGRPEDETSLECLCVLLTAIGKQLETPAMQTPVEASSSTVRSPLDLSRYKSSNG